MDKILKLSFDEEIHHNEIKFMFEKIFLDNEQVPGVHNFDWR